MDHLSLTSRVLLYVLVGLTGLYTVLLWVAQITIIKGRPFKNPDGSVDDWREQKLIYGIAFADIVWSCPVTLMGVALVFLVPRWGVFIVALSSFWAVWANIMTTATSLRFYHPRITGAWLVGFPLGIVISLAYLVWTVVNFTAIFGTP